MAGMPVTRYEFAANSATAFYVVIYLDHPRAMDPPEIEQVLDVARADIIASLQGQVLEEEPLTLQGHAGRDVQLLIERPDPLSGHLRLFLGPRRLYQILVLTTDQTRNAADIATFLRSFRIIP